MKKLVLMMTGLFLITTAISAQDKEALKAQKEARKAAESTLKKAKTTYELSIPNVNVGRKETDYNKLEGALPLIQAAIQNEYTKDNIQTWQTAADIEYQYYLKQDNEMKADPDNEELRKTYLETSAKVVEYCVKYDSLLNLDTKLKPEEKKAAHIKYQQMAVNPALQLLQASQNFSNSDEQEDLKKGAMYADKFLYAIEKSSLMSDFKNDNLEDWKTYAKAFYAQSLYNIEGISEDKIVAAYEALMKTKYKGIACQSLANYYREKDLAKQNLYLQKGIDELKDEAEQRDLRANFAIILMQNQFQKGDKEGFLKTAELIKKEFADNENAINAYLMEGQMAFEAQDYDKAKAIFLAAKEKYPDEPKGLLMAARSAWMKAQTSGSKKADMDETISLFKQLEKENPDDSELWGEPLYILYNNTQQAALAAPYKKYYKAN